MVVNTGFSFGAKKAPLKPTNRHIVPTSPSGVTVVNLSGNVLRNHSELSELRRKVASIGNDLSSAMNALAAANAEVDCLKNLKSEADKELESLKAGLESLNSEYERLSVENENYKAKIAELSGANEDLKARLENALKSKKKKSKGESGISIEVSTSNEVKPAVSEGEVQS